MSGPFSHVSNRLAIPVVVVSTSLSAMCSCTASGPSDLSEARSLITRCDGPAFSYIAIDGTESSNPGGLEGPRERAVRGELSRVAACNGRAKVVVFSSSSAATLTLFEGSIRLVGATDQAKARRLPHEVDVVTADVKDRYAKVVPHLDPAGSDPVAQMRLFAEWRDQLGSGEFRMLELTDGMQNVGTTVRQIVASPDSAAARFPVPNLDGAEVTFAGISEVTGKVPPTTVVDALKAFYAALCKRSGAKRCRVVSEAAGAMS